MYLLGFDIGSSSVKVSLLDAGSGKVLGAAFSPKKEMEILSFQQGWAEQHPETWWQNLKLALAEVLQIAQIDKTHIKAIGISYQMHGLVCLDKEGQVLRPSIIWCDSRAVEIGNKAFESIGKEKCLENQLNSPGNFTASKLKWVKDNEPSIFEKIYKVMLPGDYIAYRLSGEITTTSTGLSEGILWDFKHNSISQQILEEFDFDNSLFPQIVPVFGEQCKISENAAKELGLPNSILITYRAGDQPNNALSLNVLNPGEVAATAGTSGVVYGVSDLLKYDPESKVNTFAHVNHTIDKPRYGVLLCVNGTGILNSWLKNNLLGYQSSLTYPQMNEIAAQAPIGSASLSVLPFGNGAERVLGNREIGAQILGLQFNTHNTSHIVRAIQEGIVFALKYGIDNMKQLGVLPHKVRAGMANMFLSPIFAETFATICEAELELYNTDGAQGAARGAGIGAKIYQSPKDAFESLKTLKTISPQSSHKNELYQAYQTWTERLERTMNK